MEKLLIIIPAYNELNNLPSLLQDIDNIKLDQFSQIDTIVINDGSSDGTEQLDIGSQKNKFDLCANLGIGGAVQTGLIYASLNNYDFAMQVDGDGQHPPSEIFKFFEGLKNFPTANMIIGSRYLETEGFKSSLMRRIGIKLISLVIAIFTGKKILDTTSGFRLFDRNAIRYFAKNYPDEFPEPESLVMASLAGFEIVEIPVKMRSRSMGKSSITPLKSVYYMCKVLLAIFYTYVKTKYTKVLWN